MQEARLGDVSLTPGPDGGYSGRALYWPTWAAPSTTDAIKSARISLGGPVAAMIFTRSDELWNGDTHDVEKAAAYLEGTGISWRELVPRVRAELERDWQPVLRLTESLLARQRLTGEDATAVIEGPSGRGRTS